MSIPKITGLETEYGIVVQGAPRWDPISASHLLLACCTEAGKTSRASVRATSQVGARAVSRVTTQRETAEAMLDLADVDLLVSNAADMDSAGSLMLPNGSRFYVDHAHPEYSTPETLDPRATVAADKAGEIIVERCQRRVNSSGLLPKGQQIVTFKNNSDQKGHSYGCHENYLLEAPLFEALMERKWHRTLATLVPFLVTRTLICGAGKACVENGAPPAGYQLAQRADFFETLIGLQTTHHRPIVNTRDEPHATTSRLRRLHVIAGDANMAEHSTYLKVGTMQLVLRMLEDDCLGLRFILEDPVSAIKTVSRDLDFSETLPLDSGEPISALNIQYAFMEAAANYVKDRAAEEGIAALAPVVDLWRDTLDKISTNWRLLNTRLDWAIKRSLLERTLERAGVDWDTATRWQLPIERTLEMEGSPPEDPSALLSALKEQNPASAEAVQASVRENHLDWNQYWDHRRLYFNLRRLDLEYHRLGQEDPTARGLFYQLQDRGVVDRLVDAEEVARLVDAPPPDTRAYLRGYCLGHYADAIRYADWEEIGFNDARKARTVRLTLPDPRGGTAEQVGAILARNPDWRSLMATLQAQSRASE